MAKETLAWPEEANGSATQTRAEVDYRGSLPNHAYSERVGVFNKLTETETNTAIDAFTRRPKCEI